ncbi:S8 family serine peptidase [Aquabacterium sp.]|uniref:S8 family serine peptidase n=1 Tax=Aquabacterium sp. TaxID=1872578 RepID=UPI002BCFC037|nr:S8 family serine peptidase [Aquabacterium sp.]HSW03199.1 S8 family serine peptidase [Aquabacterium sp.]
MLAMPLAAQAQATSQNVRVAIAYKSGTGLQVRAAVLKAGGTVSHDMGEADSMIADLPRAKLATLRAMAQVEFVDAGVQRSIQGQPGKRVRAAVTSSQTVPYGITMVQADQVSDASAGNRKVCIVDSGIDTTHEDLAAIPKTGENFTSSGTWDSDENSHGTHVAGTIAAINNSVGVIGVAPSGNLKLHIAKVFDVTGSASSLVIAKAMLSCVRARANVVSMSLGGSSPSPIEQRVATLMSKRGMLVIAAAGNAGDTSTSYPAGFVEVMSVAAIDENMAKAGFSQSNADVEIAAPGVAVLSTIPPGIASDGTLTVGASPYAVIPMTGSPRTTATGPLADFGLGDTPVAGSMSGSVCLISRGSIAFSDKVLNCQNSGGIGAVIYNNAAGELLGTLGDVATTIPSVGALQSDGATMLTQLGQSTTVTVVAGTALYANFNGTSMATPHVSAVAALVWSLHTGCTAEQIRSTLNKSAVDLGAVGRDNDFGFGLVQAKVAHDRITSMGCTN